ncbi:protein-tyrosine phosphatase-like protein [Aspergillus tetrazonus]
MSAMTGPRSPTSPWPQEPQSLALPGPSSSAALFPLSDSRPSFNRFSPRGTSSRGTAAELPDNYFSFNTESSNNFKGKGHFSHALPNHSPEGRYISGKDLTEQQPASIGTGSGKTACIPDPAVYRLSLNRQAGDSTSSGTTKSVSAPVLGSSVRLVSSEACAEFVGSHADDLMLLDVRPYAHFSRGNIKGALNLCIPTTLLKRPSFDTKKLANTFTNEADWKNFGRWRQCRYIIVYDAATSNMKDAAPLVNVVKKFTAEGWNGDGMILMGGFKAFSSRFPELTQQPQQQHQPALDAQSEKISSMHIDLPQSAPVAGGCNIPESSNAAIPFFGNIRQHMDLLGGVGQIPLKHSEHLPASQRQSLPPWLREVSDPADQGRLAASRFFDIEKTELERMKQAFSYDQDNNSGSDRPSSPRYRVAGIEKGAKNRYNDIYPYDHSRVKLHDIPHGGCDYVNASYLKAEYSNRHYIATQAPVPDTFNDFWRVIWEQDIRLVVSLTAEVERGQVKCHPYWKTGTYGQFHVNNFSKKYIPMVPTDSQPVDSVVEKSSTDSGDNPTLIVRHFGLSHSGFPFEPLREVTQIQYADWPDFGTTSQPRHLLSLIEQCDKVRNVAARAAPGNPNRPVLVHCSAGCGRTGTFCTVDSVLDVLKRQRAQPGGQHDGRPFDQLLGGGQLDLVAKTLSDFRTQRPSVVQNLSQFVLCYESILEWAVTQMPGESPG